MKEFYVNLKKVYNYGKKYKLSLFVSIIVSIIYVVLNVIVPIIGAKQILYLSNNLYEELVYTSLLLLSLSIISVINNAILRYSSQIFFRGTTKDIQLHLSKEILKIEVSNLDKTNSGIFINRIGSDTNEMAKIFSSGINKITNIITCIGIFITVFIINKLVFLFYVITVLILCLMHVYKARSVNQHDKIKRLKKDRTIGLISELVRGIRDIKMLNAKDSFMNTIKDSIDEYTDSMFKMRNKEIKEDLKIGISSSIIDFLLIILLVILISKSLLSVSFALVLYNYKTKLLYNFIEYIGEFLLEIKDFNLSSNRVFNIIDNDEFTKEKFGNKHIDIINGKIEFKNVKFGYDNNNLFNSLSFKVDENDMVAIVGKSGQGKTTIFNLLCKLYNIESGNIKIDDFDINELDEYSIRNNITIISQNPYIFNMSIKDNLRLVKQDVTDDEIKNACKLSCLDDFIETLPDKYDTIVGENGITLSGGERQRLAIARAFVQNTKIILFDEATSALDNETQSKIQKAINNLKGKYTIVIIAHRLTTINNVNKILLLENGKIIAEGTHKELLKNSNEYKKLYEKEIE